MPPTNKTSAPITARSNDDESLGEWVALHKTPLSWGLLALVVLLGGGWFYQRSQALKSERAEKAYYQGAEEAGAGNNQLAIADLKDGRPVFRHSCGGRRARIYLAQMYYTDKKFKEGLAELQKAEKNVSSGDDFAPSIHVLEGNGYEELKDFVHAAEQYQQAADKSRFPNDKRQDRAYQARALTAAGKRAEALAIWEDLATDETSPFALEAKLRIGGAFRRSRRRSRAGFELRPSLFMETLRGGYVRITGSVAYAYKICYVNYPLGITVDNGY